MIFLIKYLIFYKYIYMIIISEIKPKVSPNKNIFICILITFIICFLVYRFLKDRTVEVEKFSNTPIVYSSSGKDINVKKQV